METLKGEFDDEMYAEARLQANAEIFEEVYNHEFTKAQAEVKRTHEVDLHPLRLATRERVDYLLNPEGRHTPRSARGMISNYKGVLAQALH